MFQLGRFRVYPLRLSDSCSLLEYRPDGLGEAYTALFPHLLTPALWQSTGNVPALVRLLKAYLNKAAGPITSTSCPCFEIFQQLLSTGDTASIDLFVLFGSFCSARCHGSGTETSVWTFVYTSTRCYQSHAEQGPRLVIAITNFFALFFAASFVPRPFLIHSTACSLESRPDIVTNFWCPRLNFQCQFVWMPRLK